MRLLLLIEININNEDEYTRNLHQRTSNEILNQVAFDIQ